MTDVQENHLSMFRTLLAIRALFSAVIAAMADVDADFADLETEVNAIKLLLPKQQLQTKGVARDKADVVEDLAEAATVVAGAVMAFASKAHNNTLFEEVKYSQSKLEHLRDELLPDTCRIIHDRANSNLAALAGRGITPLVLTDFMGLITELEGMTTAPRTATTQKSTATTDMSVHFAQANKIIKERLDGGMKIFIATEPDLYITYRNGRKIVDAGHRKKKDTETGILVYHVTDASNGNPLGETVVNVDERAGTTDEEGNGKIKGLTPGNKNVHFLKPGYSAQDAPALIEKGKVTTVNIQLIPSVSSSVTGTVNGRVLMGAVSVAATVSVEGTTISTTTDPMGYFTLNNVPQGAQVIRARETANLANTLTNNTTVVAGGTVTVNFNFP